MGLQPPYKCLHVPWQFGCSSFIWPPLLHWDGVTFGKTSEDHHRCLCYKDDERTEVDVANFPNFHSSYSLHCCQCFGQIVEKGPGWGSGIESFRMVVHQTRVHTIYFHTNILCSVFVQQTTVQVRKSPTGLSGRLATCSHLQPVQWPVWQFSSSSNQAFGHPIFIQQGITITLKDKVCKQDFRTRSFTCRTSGPSPGDVWIRYFKPPATLGRDKLPSSLFTSSSTTSTSSPRKN